VSGTTSPDRGAGHASTSVSATDWQDRAACRDDDTGVFDYDPETDPARKAEAAKAICAGCQVRDACLGFALSQPADEDTIGIYGGLTPAERYDLRQRKPWPAEPRRWSPAADPTFAQVSFALATEIGVERTAEALGVANRTLHRAWNRHGLGPRPNTARAAHPDAAPWLIEQALRKLGHLSREGRPHHLTADPEFAASSFELAGRLGAVRAAERLGVYTTTLYRAWDRHELGRPDAPPTWTQQLLNDRDLVERAFTYARRTSILAAASEFQTSAPTLRRAFNRHGLGHPHADLDRGELRSRWTEEPGPDHRNRIQRREYRARRATERRAARAATPSERSAAPSNRRARRSRDDRDEERSR
jgi:WhiB family redox-sensing transcriptional regulator